jgi:hypothetical protein
MKQPMVARLESGEHNPELKTLITISRRLGIEFMIDIAPATRLPRLVSKAIAAKAVTREAGGVSITYATARL